MVHTLLVLRVYVNYRVAVVDTPAPPLGNDGNLVRSALEVIRDIVHSHMASMYKFNSLFSSPGTDFFTFFQLKHSISILINSNVSVVCELLYSLSILLSVFFFSTVSSPAACMYLPDLNVLLGFSLVSFCFASSS